MNLNQITLAVDDMPAATSFYLKLGFTQIVDTAHYARFVAANEATFSLHLQDPPIHNSAVIYFEHAQLDDWVADLQAKGLAFEQLPTDMPYLWREAILRDPAGNVIKLYWAGDNRLNPPWRVTKRA